jgi:D-alanine-D-alanine ligase
MKHAISAIHHIAPDLCVILIMARRETAIMTDQYDGFSLAASLYDSREVDDIIAAFRYCNIDVIHFEDERSFIKWHQSGKYANVRQGHKIVYSFAINGTGRARRTLIPAYCSREGIITVNSDAYTCAIGRHKFHCNRLLESFGIPVPKSWSYDAKAGWYNDERPPNGLRVVGKATYEDGSIGLTEATIGDFSPTLERAFAEASRAVRQPLIVQQFIFGDEIQVPVMEFEKYYAPSPILVLNKSGARFKDGVILYEDAWEDHYTFTLPVNLGDHTIEAATREAIRTTKTLGHHGFARIDFRVDRDGEPFIIDTAAHPHLTRSSSFAYLLNQLGFAYEEMLLLMIATAAIRVGII